MKKASLVMPFAITLVACGGGGNNSSGNGMMPPPPTTYNLQAGIASMATHGLNDNVTLSGTVTLPSGSQSFTGAGTFSLAPGASTMFNGMPAMAQMATVSGSISVAGVIKSYSESETSYYAPSSGAFLGQEDSSEYDVAQAPFDYPTSVESGSSGVLGTILRYTDSTSSVSLGSAQVSYAVQEPMGASSSMQVTITTVIHDTQNNVTETDTMVYSLSSGNTITFVSASAQKPSGTITVTANIGSPPGGA
jgi:hypothetical protein